MKLKLGPLEYDIDFVDQVALPDGEDASTYMGLNDISETRIQVRQDKPKQFQRVVLAHEIVHAIFHNAGRNEQDEDDIDMVAFGLVEFLRRNSQIVRFLMEPDADPAP